MRHFCRLLLAAATLHTLAAQDFSGAGAVDDAINQALAQKRMPGAVLIVGHAGNVVYRKAYGNRAEVPSAEPMTLDTIFDIASLTKVVATTSSLMKLFEQGKFQLDDKITQYIPEFQGGKSDITIRNLLTHFSGLKPDVPSRPRGAATKPASVSPAPPRPTARRERASSIATSISFCSANWFIA